MKKMIFAVSASSLILMLFFIILYKKTAYGAALTCSITFGTIAYHFCMRLAVGLIFSLIMNNKADHMRKWYQCRGWERKLYRKLNVKQWKNKLPTFDPDTFDLRKHSPEEIVQAMCQAELVHETAAALSLLPILLSIRFGALPVFIITSLLGMMLDLIFVMIQRYNRPRVVKLMGQNSRRSAAAGRNSCGEDPDRPEE